MKKTIMTIHLPTLMISCLLCMQNSLAGMMGGGMPGGGMGGGSESSFQTFLPKDYVVTFLRFADPD